MFEKTKKKIKQIGNTVYATTGAIGGILNDRYVNTQLKTLERYNIYRKASSWILLFFMFQSLWTHSFSRAITIFCLLHVFILINQLWWKLINIEHYLVKRDNQNGEKIRNNTDDKRP